MFIILITRPLFPLAIRYNEARFCTGVDTLWSQPSDGTLKCGSGSKYRNIYFLGFTCCLRFWAISEASKKIKSIFLFSRFRTRSIVFHVDGFPYSWSRTLSKGILSVHSNIVARLASLAFLLLKLWYAAVVATVPFVTPLTASKAIPDKTSSSSSSPSRQLE